MAANTKIQWADHTFNPWRGCVKIAAGCANCYAETQSKRNPATLGVWGPHGTRVVASEAMWRQPLKWDREAAKTGERPRVFCASLADVFEDWGGFVCNSRGEPLHDAEKWLRGKSGGGGSKWLAVPGQFVGRSLVNLDDVRARLFRTIDATPNLDWLLLTKRPENIRRMWTMTCPDCLQNKMNCGHWPAIACARRNVWLGVSIACRADLRLLDELRRCRDLCAKTFVSAEPLLGDLGEIDLTGIDWVIVGGESGPNARPCDVAWIRSIVRQCKAAGVPCFVKQVGTRPVDFEAMKCVPGHDRRIGGVPTDEDLSVFGRMLEIVRLGCRDKKGGDPAEWPEDLRVREVPT